ncbi:NAD(P)/FAD-dependent oxidoreductase [soil metagenome]
MPVVDVVIIGGGAAGLATAIFARRAAPAASVLVLEGARRPGAKILVSGGSRCNVTNRVVTERDFNGGKSTTVRRVLRSLPVDDTVRLFAEWGVALHEEAHGKLFPDSNRSRDVLEALLNQVEAAGAALQLGTRVTGVQALGDRFEVRTARETLEARAVVFATGGLALPKSGSDGAGLEMVRALGHSLVPTTPALAPLVLEAEGPHRALQGIAHEAELALAVDGRIARRVGGALLWTHFGISGPAALDMSRHWLRARLEGRLTRLSLSFYPEMAFEAVDARWMETTRERPRMLLATALGQAVPAAIAAALLRRISLDGAVPLASLDRESRRRLVHAVTDWELPVAGSRGYTYAEVTAGGVPLEEIDPASMESRRCPGLFLVGEILNVDGRLGGFNFQWAWASARAAATGLAGTVAGRRKRTGERPA